MDSKCHTLIKTITIINSNSRNVIWHVIAAWFNGLMLHSYKIVTFNSINKRTFLVCSDIHLKSEFNLIGTIALDYISQLNILIAL